MDVFQLARMLRRWWFIAVPAVALSFVAAITLTDNIQPEYTARGSVVFVGPLVREAAEGTGEFEAINPLLEQPAALTTAAVITSMSINTPDVGWILAQEGLSTDYEVGPESRTPIVHVLARGTSRDQAIGTAVRLTELIERDVRLRQEAAEVPSDQLVSTNVIALSAQGGADYGARGRLRLVIVALGLGVTLGAVFLLEGLSRRRAARAESGRSSGTSAPPPDETVDQEVDDGTVDDGTVDDGTVDDGTVDDGTVDDGTVDDGTVDDGTVDDGTVDDGTVDDGTVDDGTVDDGTVDDGTVDDGTVDDGTVDDGTVDDGTVDDGTVDDGTVDDGTVDDGTVDDVADDVADDWRLADELVDRYGTNDERVIGEPYDRSVT